LLLSQCSLQRLNLLLLLIEKLLLLGGPLRFALSA